MDDNTQVWIYIERIVGLVDNRSAYDPSLNHPEFYAHIVHLGGAMPCECEIRLSTRAGEDMITITPRQLDEEGDLEFPVEALDAAIDQIRKRTEQNRNAQAERVGVKLDIEGEGSEVA